MGIVKIKKTIRNIQDKYNTNKVWSVTHTVCGHYYVTQYICGKQFSKKVRVTRKWLKQILPDWY